MTDESLSALLDGELQAHELDALIEAMDADPALGAKVSRWSAGRALIRGQGSLVPGADIADRVMAAVRAESLPLAGGVSGNVVPLSAGRWRSAWRPAAGLAAAAAVVGAVVLSFSPRDDSSEPGIAGLAVAGDTLPEAEAPRLVASRSLSSTGSGAGSVSSQVVDLRPNVTAISHQGGLSAWEREPENRLHTYYIDYSGHRSVQGIGGPLGYARFAAHNADMRADSYP